MLDVNKLIKYLLEGAAVAFAAFYIPRRKADLQEITLIALTAAATFLVLDVFSPTVASGTRQGAGFGIGYNITTGLEGFEDGDDLNKCLDRCHTQFPEEEGQGMGQNMEQGMGQNMEQSMEDGEGEGEVSDSAGDTAGDIGENVSDDDLEGFQDSQNYGTHTGGYSPSIDGLESFVSGPAPV